MSIRNKGTRRRVFVMAVAISTLALAMQSRAHAQSSTRSSGSATRSSGSATRQATSVGLEGYCPVCIIKMKKWVRGNPQIRADYDGKTYHFPGAEQREMFLADPAAFVPALGGDCTVCLAKMGKRMPGSVRHAALYQDRIFLFPAAQQRAEFLKDPKAYAGIDLALEGNCAVCRAHMNKQVPGKPEFTAVHQGLRYLFPSAKERDMFLADPGKYAVSPSRATQAAVRAGRDQLVSVSGTSGCAGCEHGITPIGATETLGLAVNTQGGRVFVVEDAHELYPSVYKNRFDGLSLRVSGEVLKNEGRVTWNKLGNLKVLQ